MRKTSLPPGLALAFFSILSNSCSSPDKNTNNITSVSENVLLDSCSIAKHFENITITESLVKPDYSGELKNYFGTDTTKVDFKHFFENGKLIRSIFYFENGKIQEEFSFKCGALHGNQKYYYENGKLSKLIPFSYGYRHGTGELFDENGILRQQVTFLSDSLIGEPKNFDENGTLISTPKE